MKNTASSDLFYVLEKKMANWVLQEFPSIFNSNGTSAKCQKSKLFKNFGKVLLLNSDYNSTIIIFNMGLI